MLAMLLRPPNILAPKVFCFKIYLQYQGIYNTINAYCLPIQNLICVLHLLSTLKNA
jgi:hypothetical protein